MNTIVNVVLGGLVLGVLAGFAWLSQEPAGCLLNTYVAGMPVDHARSVAEVEHLVRQRAHALCATPVTVTTGAHRMVVVTPRQMGILPHCPAGAVIAYYDAETAAAWALLRGREPNLLDRLRSRLSDMPVNIPIPVRLVDATRRLPRAIRRLEHDATPARIVFTQGGRHIQPAIPGVSLSPTTTWETLTAGLTAGQQTIILPATVTTPPAACALPATLTRRVSYSLPITSPAPNAFANITRLATMLDGTILQPGVVFSLNHVTGRRTAQNGWKPAPSYLNGKVVNTDAGGVCCTASCLFGTVIRDADCKIVARRCHSKLPKYCRNRVGQDAALAGTHIDLRLVNRSATPIVVHLRTDRRSRRVICELYGAPMTATVRVLVVKDRTHRQPVYFTSRTIDGVKEYLCRSQYR
jgi:vancomycin resistance protein YoaR